MKDSYEGNFPFLNLSFESNVLLLLDMERAIIGDLVSHILQFSLPLIKAADFAAELDW